jgi:hypothetical protein
MQKENLHDLLIRVKTGEVSPEQALENLRTGHTKIWVLPAGSPPAPEKRFPGGDFLSRQDNGANC